MAAVTVDFCDYFWVRIFILLLSLLQQLAHCRFQGEKNEGFNVLYQNMKGGISAGKELGDFLRERARLEEDNCKAQAKLSSKLTPATLNNTCGTFTPLLLAFKATSDKLSGIHNQWSMKLNDLLREVLKYNDEQTKKHKQMKEDQSPTLDAVKSIQESTVALQNKKEIYKQKCADLEKLKRENARLHQCKKTLKHRIGHF